MSVRRKGWREEHGASEGQREMNGLDSLIPPCCSYHNCRTTTVFKDRAAEEAGRTKKVNRFAAIEMDCAAAVFGAFPRRGGQTDKCDPGFGGGGGGGGEREAS